MYTFFLYLHFLGLTLGVGSGLAMIRIMMSNRDLPPAERGPFMQRVSSLRKNASMGFGFLILSGLGMLWMRPGLFRAGGGLFHAKLTLVAIMALIMGVMDYFFARARKTGTPPPAYLVHVRNLNLTLALVTILLAVLVFH